MGATSYTGPVLVSGGNTSNQDGPAPSSLAWGFGIPDPRSPNLLAEQPVVWLSAGGLVSIDQVPSALATANIAALANPTTGTPMALVSVSGAGITVTTAATVSANTGNVVPAGALIIDTAPATVSSSQSGLVQMWGPAHAIARAVSLTGVASGTGGAVTVRGYDVYGAAMTETITMTSGATTTNGVKAFKFIASVTPGFTDTHTISVGTSDVFGLPIRADRFSMTRIFWNETPITANTGFVGSVNTIPATAITGDVRGTYAVQSASDGTKRLMVFVSPVTGTVTSTNGLVGVPQFSS